MFSRSNKVKQFKLEKKIGLQKHGRKKLEKSVAMKAIFHTHLPTIKFNKRA